MKQVSWRMEEAFVFPAEIGQPTAAKEIQVTPRFTAETVEGRPKLTGIYHLAVHVNLNDKTVENDDIGESILIEDLDLNGKTGYFEYAVPFNIDFPPEAENPVDIQTLNPSYDVKDHHLSIVWDVECTYEEAGIQQQNERTKNEQTIEAERAKENNPISKSTEVVTATVPTAQGDEVLGFIAELEDGVSATSFRLNDILV